MFSKQIFVSEAMTILSCIGGILWITQNTKQENPWDKLRQLLYHIRNFCQSSVTITWLNIYVLPIFFTRMCVEHVPGVPGISEPIPLHKTQWHFVTLSEHIF